MKWFNLIIGSIAGGVSRYALAGAVYRVFGTAFPYGTFVVNMIGCLAIGFFDALASEKMVLNPELRILLMTGFCGAFTTFSAFILETSHLFRDGEIGPAAFNIVASVGIGFLLFKTGFTLGRVI